MNSHMCGYYRSGCSSTHDVTSHLQQIQNYAARVILRLPKSSSITTYLKSLHWLLVKVRNTYKIACLCYHCHSSTATSYVADILQKKPSHTRNTPAHIPCLFSIDLHTVWQHLVIVYFLLLLLLSGTLFQIMSSLSSCKSRLKTYLFRSVYKNWTLSLIIVHMCMAWPCHSFVDGIFQKCIYVYKKWEKVRLSNHDCMPILVLLYIMLYIIIFVHIPSPTCHVWQCHWHSPSTHAKGINIDP